MKPGYLTTEFWITLLTQLWGAIALLGGFNVDDSTANGAIKIGAMAAAALATAYYSHSRGRVKATAVMYNPQNFIATPAGTTVNLSAGLPSSNVSVSGGAEGDSAP